MSRRVAWLICLVLALTSGTATANDALPLGAVAGDLIFREGTESVSDAVRAVDTGEFTHVGLLLGGPGRWQVLHAVPAEVAGRADGVVIDSLAFFLDRRRARNHAVFHVHADAAQRARALAQARAMLGRPFRIADAAGSYCTALVWSAWMQAGVDLQVRFTTLPIPLLPGRYLLPSTLQHSPRLTRLPGRRAAPPAAAIRPRLRPRAG